MKLDENYLNKLLTDISSGKDIKLSDIPDIDLYMDQVTTFIDSKLGHLKRDENDKLLTKTMINNYTKSKILFPSKNKKYNRQHIILLILIYYLKQILSINDISALFSPLFNSMDDKENEYILDDIYAAFLDLKENDFSLNEETFSHILELIKEKTQGFKEENRDFSELLLTVIMLIVKANAQKRLAEKIIDEFFKKQDL